MFTIRALSPNNAVEVELNPMPTEDALRRVIGMRDEGFRNITLTDADSGVAVDIEKFMRSPPSA